MESNLSIFSLVVSAGFVVQLVMLILILMSIYSWTIILGKKKKLWDEDRDIKNFQHHFAMHSDIHALNENLAKTEKSTALERIFSSGYKEFSLAKNAELAYRAMNNEANQALGRLENHLSVLAMIASSSPYIGLFGTVWGIMHAFIALSSVKQATIAIVAPGIAEALIATAFGLFAAIPATIAYNRLLTHVGNINDRYTAFVEKCFLIFQKQS